MYTPNYLQTSRLRLRPFMMEDASELFRYASDTEFSKYLNYDAPNSKDDAIDFLRMVLAGEMGTNLWAITLAEEPKVIGAVQFDVESSDSASLHYEVARWLWGRGIASEAVAAILDWAKKIHPKIRKIQADTHIKNLASRRILEKFGFMLISIEDDVAYYVQILPSDNRNGAN